MVYAVQGDLAFRNTARRDAVLANTLTRISQSQTWGEVSSVAYTTEAGDPAFAITVRFVVESSADGFWADVQSFVGTGVNGPVTGSRIWRHDCPHDELVHQPCVESEARAW